MDVPHELRFAWWNTSLSPPRTPRHNGEDRWGVASEVVRRLIDEDAIDLLTLGEVTDADISRLRRACSATRLKMVLPELSADGRRGLGAIYNPDKLTTATKPRFSSFKHRGQRLSGGLHVSFKTRASPTPLHAFVVHWPSRRMSHHGARRRAAGHELQQRVHQLQAREARTPIVVLGDFNDEPFDESVGDGLQGTRDRTLARKKGLLYNPSWRFLGERQTLQEEGQGRLAPGTCFYRSNTSTHWYTLDQILVSSSTLLRDGWTLLEEATQVWQRPPLLSKSGRLTLNFDHFPVVGMLTYEPRTAAPRGE